MVGTKLSRRLVIVRTRPHVATSGRPACPSVCYDAVSLVSTASSPLHGVSVAVAVSTLVCLVSRVPAPCGAPSRLSAHGGGLSPLGRATQIPLKVIAGRGQADCHGPSGRGLSDETATTCTVSGCEGRRRRARLFASSRHLFGHSAVRAMVPSRTAGKKSGDWSFMAGRPSSSSEVASWCLLASSKRPFPCKRGRRLATSTRLAASVTLLAPSLAAISCARRCPSSSGALLSS